MSFANPQSPVEMITGSRTCISTQYHQLRTGTDAPAITGLCKALIEADDEARCRGEPRVLDVDFIAEHTYGFEAFADYIRKCEWTELERLCGLTRSELESAATVYARASAVIAVYGMGLTQHRNGVENVQMVSNLLLLRGNMGKPGAGICQVRGHSND